MTIDFDSDGVDSDTIREFLEVKARFEINRRRLFNLMGTINLANYAYTDLNKKNRKKADENRRVAELWAKHTGRQLPELLTLESFVDEILRAAVVFLHAIFEDALRQIASIKLSKNPADTLDTLTSGKKFTIGELSKRRGITVDNLIEESIQEYLDEKSKTQKISVDELILRTIDSHLAHKSFNTTKDVVLILSKLGLDRIRNIDTFYPLLDAMMTRRHQIVHNADIQGKAGANNKPTPITVDDVDQWVDNASGFIYSLVYIELAAAGYLESNERRNSFV